MLAQMHREDVKASLRKRFGSVAEFERVRELPAKSVNEVLRGRANARVTQAIETALTEETPTAHPEYSGDNGNSGPAHRLNAGSR